MNFKNLLRTFASIAIGFCAQFISCDDLHADVFNMPGALKSLEFVTVGNAGNASDSATGRGAVSYEYQIGKFEVTGAQYTEFLNAVAKTDTYNLYSSNMVNSNNLTRTGSVGSYVYSVGLTQQNFPIANLSWGDAARFINWIENGQPIGSQGSGTTETGSYALNGAISDAALAGVIRNPSAKYHFATNDEWYKSAYYKGGSLNAGYWLFPTKSDSIPSTAISPSGTNNANYNFAPSLISVGTLAASPSPYGTFDQAGNAFEMIELQVGGSYAVRGGSYLNQSFSLRSTNQSGVMPLPTFENGDIGFRIAVTVPEPSTIVGFTFVFGTLFVLRKYRQ